MAICAGQVVIEAQDPDHPVPFPMTESVNIGLLISESKASSVKHAAELAIREANKKGDYSGDPFHLVVRSTAGPWGAGSKQSVGLVFDDEVVAIMGSLDSRNAHLAEQVATKTRILFLSAWATDITLSQAFVPWYFRCLPNDDQQAIALIQEIYNKRKINRVAIIGTEDYDSRNAVRSFIKTAASMNISTPRQFLYRSDERDLENALNEIHRDDIEAIVLFGKPALASKVIPMMQEGNMDIAIFGTLSITDDRNASGVDRDILEGINLVSSGHWFTEEGIAFQKAFQRMFGYQPGVAAAYAYDGINLIIEVIKKKGPARDEIIDAFTKLNYRSGITGGIRFDSYGNRMGTPGIMTFINRIPTVINENE